MAGLPRLGPAEVCHDRSHARICPSSATNRVRIGGQEVFVYHTSAGDFATFAGKGPLSVELDLPRPVDRIRIAPAGHHLEAGSDGRLARLVLPGPSNLWIETEDSLRDSGHAGRPPLTGEFGGPGGVIAKGKTGYLIAAFSGGPSEDDVRVSRAGLEVLASRL